MQVLREQEGEGGGRLKGKIRLPGRPKAGHGINKRDALKEGDRRRVPFCDVRASGLKVDSDSGVHSTLFSSQCITRDMTLNGLILALCFRTVSMRKLYVILREFRSLMT